MSPTGAKKITVPQLIMRKREGRRIVMLTAYDATFARLLDADGAVDVVLVGDSLGMVVQGHRTTLPVTLDEMVYHTRAVSRGLCRAHLCADLPFLTARLSPEETLRAAGRLVQEGRAESVKIEGGMEQAATIARLVGAGIPVVGHVGLLPQSVHALGGFRMQGRTAADRERILADARAVAEAGAFCLVLESLPVELAEAITAAVPIPTVGIGAGAGCDGQVLVIYDLLGLDPGFCPRFVKRYAELGGEVRAAVRAFADEVRRGVFPAAEHGTRIDESEGLAAQVPYGGGPDAGSDDR